MAKIKAHINGTKKDVILKNAAVLFKKNGFKATSLRELAETMNIEAPSLYNHIANKQELLKEICFGISKDFTTHMEQVLASKAKPDEKVSNLIRFHIQKTYTDFDNVFVSNHEWKLLQQKDLTVFLKQRKNYEANFISIIQQGIKLKIFKTLDAQIAVLTILSALRGLEFLQNNIKSFSLKQLEENLEQQLLFGIKNK